MRIGLQVYGDLSPRSGGYIYDAKLVDYLQRAGDAVELFSLPPRSYPRALIRNAPPDANLQANLDVLIQDELVHPCVYRMNRRLRQRAGFPIVGLVHLLGSFSRPPGPLTRMIRRIETAYLTTLDGLILNSRTSRDQALQLLDGALPPHVVAVPAADHFPAAGPADPGRALRPAAGPLRVLYIGNVIAQKGLHVLLRALARLPAGDWHLTVIGRLDLQPGYAARIRRLIRRLDLAERVDLRGPVAHADLPAVYRSRHVLVMPSVNEAYGMVYLEAQQFGLPAVGTTAGGAGEIIRHGENGYLIAPRDDATLATVLQHLHRDREHLQVLGRQARADYLGHPGWDDTCAGIRGFLQDLLGTHGWRP